MSYILENRLGYLLGACGLAYLKIGLGLGLFVKLVYLNKPCLGLLKF